MAQAAQGGGEVIVSGGVQNRVDVTLKDMVSGHGGGRLVVGRDDLMVFSIISDSMIL